MSKEDKYLFSLLKARALEVMPRGVRVFLYGSKARGDGGVDSDWDILILVNKPRAEMSDFDVLSFPLTELGWEHGAAVIPIIFGEEEWNHESSLLFRKSVEQDAIALV